MTPLMHLMTRSGGPIIAVVLLSNLAACSTIPVILWGPRLDDPLKPRPVLVDKRELPVPFSMLVEGDAHKDSPSARIRAARGSDFEEAGRRPAP